ncbi:MAG: hypothetical protein DRR19_07935 [Candidatus Parabeggiatoa sp. nov. 1]|nr:MAG: hypothetical protein DRR19_07935 [Gammaproteobacteria bacterium]
MTYNTMNHNTVDIERTYRLISQLAYLCEQEFEEVPHLVSDLKVKSQENVDSMTPKISLESELDPSFHYELNIVLQKAKAELKQWFNDKIHDKLLYFSEEDKENFISFSEGAACLDNEQISQFCQQITELERYRVLLETCQPSPAKIKTKISTTIIDTLVTKFIKAVDTNLGDTDKETIFSKLSQLKQVLEKKGYQPKFTIRSIELDFVALGEDDFTESNYMFIELMAEELTDMDSNDRTFLLAMIGYAGAEDAENDNSEADRDKFEEYKAELDKPEYKDILNALS